MTEGDELVWELGENGIEVRKAARSAGRETSATDASDEKREEMEAEIRRMRETEWNPE